MIAPKDPVLIPCLDALVLHHLPGTAPDCSLRAMAFMDCKGAALCYVCDPETGAHAALYPSARESEGYSVATMLSVVPEGVRCRFRYLLLQISKAQRPWLRCGLCLCRPNLQYFAARLLGTENTRR